SRPRRSAMAGAEISAGEADQMTIACASPAGRGSSATTPAVTIGDTTRPQIKITAMRTRAADMRQRLRPVDADHRRGGEQEDECREQRPQPGGEARQRQPDEYAPGHEAGSMATEKGQRAVKEGHGAQIGTLSRTTAHIGTRSRR